MRRRHRKLVGSIGMIIFIIVYALIVMVIAQGRIQDAPKLAQTLFFLVAGLIWVVPLLPLIRWMERRDAEP